MALRGRRDRTDGLGGPSYKSVNPDREQYKQLYGCGIIESDYQFEPDRSEYRSTRKVRWLKDGNWPIPDNARVPLKTLTDVSNYQSFLAFALPILKETDKNGGKWLVEE